MIPSLLGGVAQLGERRVRNAKVEGSIPFRSTINSRLFAAPTQSQSPSQVHSKCTRRTPLCPACLGAANAPLTGTQPAAVRAVPLASIRAYRRTGCAIVTIERAGRAPHRHRISLRRYASLREWTISRAACRP